MTSKELDEYSKLLQITSYMYPNSIARLLSGEAVNIFVGAKRKCFVVHKALISASCIYFKRAISRSEENGVSSDGYYLPDDDAEVFHLFHTWLYSHKLRPITKICREREGEFEDDHVASTNMYFELYFMTEARGLRDLQNLTIDRIREYYALEDIIAGSKRCEQVYQKTKPGSPIRNLMVQQFLSIWLSKRQCGVEAESALRARLRMKHGVNFMVDLFEAMRQKLGKRSWGYPNEGNNCVFHFHEPGRKCEVVQLDGQ